MVLCRVSLPAVLAAGLIGTGHFAAAGAQETAPPFDQAALDGMAKEGSKGLPSFAYGAKWVSVQSAPGRVLTSTYEFPQSSVGLRIPKDLEGPLDAFRKSMCLNSGTAAMLKDGVSLRLVFRTSDYVELYQIVLNATDCGFDTSLFSSGDGFSGYPAATYKGSIKLPDFAGRDKSFASYRTRISEGMREGPNFAGSMALIEIGCGTSCRFAYAGDVSTGKVYAFPLGGEGNYSMSLYYLPNSRLVVAQWEEHEENRCYQARYIWTSGSFRLVEKRVLGPREACS